MALFRKLFYRKPPDGLLEISERVYVFDACFTTEAWEERDIKSYVRTVVGQLRDYYPDASILVFNFREGKTESEIGNALSEYDMTIMDYPRHYEGCPLLSMEVIHHFLRSSESWLSLGQQNVLLMHCERGGWPILTFMLAAHLIYMKQYTGEQRTLDMIYRQAPRELLNLLSPLNPIPSQLRYLHYISRRNVASAWPPLDRSLALDCVIMRLIPNFDGLGGMRPIFRIYGQNPFLSGDRTPKLLFSTPKRSKVVRHYKQEQCQLVKIDINCHVQGDVVLECISLHEDMEREEMIFRVMFNTAFIRSNILILNRDEIDILWDAKERFPREFRAEVLFSDMDAAASVVLSELSCFEEKDGLPIEAFAKVQEMFNSVDWIVNNTDVVQTDLDSLALSNLVQEKLNTYSHPSNETSSPSAHESKTWLKLASASLSPKTPNTPPTPPPLPPEAAKPFKPRTNDSPRKLVLSPLSLSPSKHAEAASHPLDKHAGTLTVDSFPSSSILSSTLPDSVVGSSIASKPSSPQRKPSTLPSSSMDINLPVTAPPPKQAIDAKTPTPPLPDSYALKFSATDLSHPVHASSLEPSPKLTYSAIQPPLSLSPPPPPPPPPLPNKPPSSLGTQPIIPSTPSLPSPTLPVLPPLKEAPIPPTPPPTIVSSSKDNQDVRTSSPLSPPQTDSSLKEYQDDKTPLPPAPPPHPLAPPMKDQSDMKQEPSSIFPSTLPPSPPPPPPLSSSKVNSAPLAPPPPPPQPLSSSKVNNAPLAPPPPPPPMKDRSDINQESSSMSPGPPPPPPPLSSSKVTGAPSAPPPPAPPSTISLGGEGVPKVPSSAPPTPLAPFGSSSGAKLKSLTRTSSKNAKKLKPLHWLKLTRAVQGSLWAETQKSGEFSKAPEIDITELESLFSAAVPSSDQNGLGRGSSRANLGNKPEKVQLVDHRRAYNCEIMLSKVKVPLQELMSSVLSLVDSALDVDQVDNLIKFCPTKEEMELLKGYTGDKENLGKCEQFFLELMQIPRIEAKLRIFSFKMQFHAQVSDLRKNLNIVNSVSEQARSSVKFKRVMQTILSLGNALNQGTARGSAVGFKLDSLPKLTDTRARNNKMTLMNYLCKVLIDKLPELLDFSKDLDSLESATKIQLKILAEEMQAISKGLEKVINELSMSESDGPVSEHFRKVLKEFLSYAEAEVRSLASLYSAVGRNVDSLILYFGEDPARCTFEQVVSTLLTFVRMFNNAHEENLKQVEAEKKKAEKALESEKLNNKVNNDDPRKEKVSENLLVSPVKKIK